MNWFRGRAAPGTGRMQGAATRRSGATARSRNTAGGLFPGLPTGFGREGVKQGFRGACPAPAERHGLASPCALCKGLALHPFLPERDP